MGLHGEKNRIADEGVGLQRKELECRESPFTKKKLDCGERRRIAEKGARLRRVEQDCGERSRTPEKGVGLRERNKIMMGRIAEKERNL